ncbi:MAG: hypothetical protein WC069_00170 [Candidatus Shapirobacteria bacterium]
MDTNNVNIQAQNSLDTMSLLIALAFKWDKIEYKEKINSWMTDFAKDMNDAEKTEFLTKAKELGLMEYGDKI